MFIFFFNDTATTEIYTLSLHDALPIYREQGLQVVLGEDFEGDHRVRAADALDLREARRHQRGQVLGLADAQDGDEVPLRSEEHTSELQSRQYLVCRLLLEKKKKTLDTT